MKVDIKNLYVEYKHKKGNIIAVNNISFAVEDNDFLAIIGPSGCGKTTILKVILGLLDYKGEIKIDGLDESRLNIQKRNFAYISQSYSLYPNMTVFENISFPLRMNKTPIEEIKRRVGESAKLLDIECLLSRKPRQISGGQQQKVAIAKAIIKNPSLYLFDEPFSNLDNKTRTESRHQLIRLHQEIAGTFIFVTHDQTEAMALASRLIVMNQGKIEQIGSPLEVYNNPVNDFVYEFMHQRVKHD
ncbi:MAG: ABC transporter ATP-binding protein [Bacilli bacterium]|nr:ABC transporter ATP-binding protein [Bacilli bacterium]